MVVEKIPAIEEEEIPLSLFSLYHKKLKCLFLMLSQQIGKPFYYDYPQAVAGKIIHRTVSSGQSQVRPCLLLF